MSFSLDLTYDQVSLGHTDHYRLLLEIHNTYLYINKSQKAPLKLGYSLYFPSNICGKDVP